MCFITFIWYKVFSFYFYEIVSLYAAEASLKHTYAQVILLPQPTGSYDYSEAPPHPIWYEVFSLLFWSVFLV
jgi:hypothetical protein